MVVPNGSVIPKKWTPLRREIERLLADGAWREDDLLYCHAARYVDPRLAARFWIGEYKRNSKRNQRLIEEGERLPPSQAWLQAQPRAMKVGVRGAYRTVMHSLVKQGRLEQEVWNGRRRFRIKP